MTTSDEKQVEQLKDLAAKGWNSLTGSGNDSEFIHYATAIRYGQLENRMSDSFDVRKELAKVYLPYIHTVVTDSNVPSAHLEEIEGFMDVVLDNNLVKYMLTESGYADLFAGAALIVTALGQDKNSTLGKHAHSLTKALAKHHIPDGHTFSLEEMAVMLYGSGVWALYADEVEKPELLARHLMLHQIPLLQAVTNNGLSDDKSVYTPTDLYL